MNVETTSGSPHTAVPAGPAPVTQRAPISPGRRYLSLALLLAMSVFSFIDRSIISLMVGPVKADLGLSDLQIGLLQGFAFAIFYSFCAIPIGWALDRYPRRIIVYIGVTFWSLSAAACGLAQSYTQLLVMRCGVGAGEASLTPASYSILSELFPRERLTTALAIFSLGASIGSGCAMLLGGLAVDMAERGAFVWIFGDIAPWRVVFLLTGLPGFAIAFLIFLVPDTRKLANAPPRAETPIKDALVFVRQRRLFLTCHLLGFGFVTLMAFAMGAWMPTYLIRVHHWTTAQAGVAMAGSSVLSVCGVLLHGTVSDALLKRGVLDAHLRYYSWAVIGAGIAGIAAFQLSSPTATVAVGAVATALCAMSGAAPGALQLVTPPQVRGISSAMFLLVIGLLGSGAGPVVVAVLTDLVVRDEMKIGLSLSLTFAIFAPISWLLFRIGLRPMREAMLAAQQADRAAAVDRSPRE